jgi:recombinational DNA repair ATPase RecF
MNRNLPNSVISEKIAANLKSGKLKRILLQNFMCHSNFEVVFNKCVNVIVGLNGSGKSAILTAIAIGLGSRATATARSTNLKDLVRRGEHSAVIEITLANDGIDSYERKLFEMRANSNFFKTFPTHFHFQTRILVIRLQSCEQSTQRLVHRHINSRMNRDVLSRVLARTSSKCACASTSKWKIQCSSSIKTRLDHF